MTEEAAPVGQPVTADKVERQFVYHAILQDGTIVQSHGRHDFQEKIARYKPEDVRFACKGHELKATVKMSFG